MSTLSVGTIKSNTSAPPVIQNTSGTEIGTYCRAWVNWNGTGTVAIRASFNVSSITDNGTGDYTVNFTNAMPDANYAVSGVIGDGTTTDNVTYSMKLRSPNTAQVAGSVRLGTTFANPTSSAGTSADFSHVGVSIFR